MKEQKKELRVRLTSEQSNLLQVISSKRGVSKASIVRELVSKFLERQGLLK